MEQGGQGDRRARSAGRHVARRSGGDCKASSRTRRKNAGRAGRPDESPDWGRGGRPPWWAGAARRAGRGARTVAGLGCGHSGSDTGLCDRGRARRGFLRRRPRRCRRSVLGGPPVPRRVAGPERLREGGDRAESRVRRAAERPEGPGDPSPPRGVERGAVAEGPAAPRRRGLPLRRGTDRPDLPARPGDRARGLGGHRSATRIHAAVGGGRRRSRPAASRRCVRPVVPRVADRLRAPGEGTTAHRAHTARGHRARRGQLPAPWSASRPRSSEAGPSCSPSGWPPCSASPWSSSG